MSKIGEKPIAIKEGVTITKDGNFLMVKGPLGEIKLTLPLNLKAEIGEENLKLERLNDNSDSKSFHGTYARLINNAIIGVTTGFEKTLEVVGTGYRGQMEGDTLVLSLGFSHQIRFAPPGGIKITVIENKIKILGIDKDKVGVIADKVKRFRKPDPYKGKGIRYEGEKLRIKPGKVAAKAGGPGGK